MLVSVLTTVAILNLSLVHRATSQNHMYEMEILRRLPASLQGPYCASEGPKCCPERDDSCSRPIFGTTCYCDEFCDWESRDCCPDFYTSCSIVTNSDLRALSSELWALDSGRLGAPNLVIDLQGSLDLNTTDLLVDRAPDRLFRYVNPAFDTRPNVASFIKLLDNYEVEMEVREVRTLREIQEEDDFIETIIRTPVMRKAESFLLEHQLLNSTYTIRDALKQLWFKLYSRRGDGILDSCGFEHVFVGEHKFSKLYSNYTSGFHSWIQFAREERAENIEYFGYTHNHPNIAMGGRFTFKDQVKPLGVFFLGTSPEFDLALFTSCIMARPNQKCPIVAGGEELNVQTWDSIFNPGLQVASSYLFE